MINEWRWETFGCFALAAAVLRMNAREPIGLAWIKSVYRVDVLRRAQGIPSIFE